MGPTLGFDTIGKKQFFDQIWCFFYNKNKVLTIVFIIMRKSHFNDVFLVLLGPHNQQVFCMFK
jgi:hypothetical protein